MTCLSRHYTTALDDLPIRILSEFENQPGLRLTLIDQVRVDVAAIYMVLRHPPNTTTAVSGMMEA